MSRSQSLTHIVAAVVALVLGLVLGGLGPRGEARALREKVVELEGRECRAGGGIGAEIAGALRGRPMAFGGPAASTPAPTTEAPASEPPLAPSEAEVTPPIVADPSAGEEVHDNMDAIAEAMELRRRQSEQALFDYGELDDAQQDEAVQVIDALNEELGVLADEFVQTMDGVEEPDRREAMLFARDAIDVLLDAEDGLLGLMDDGQREGVSPELTDPFNYVDSSVVWVLSELDRP